MIFDFATINFSRKHIDQMLKLRQPLALITSHMPSQQCLEKNQTV